MPGQLDIRLFARLQIPEFEFTNIVGSGRAKTRQRTLREPDASSGSVGLNAAAITWPL
jgi:hypothetical protein